MNTEIALLLLIDGALHWLQNILAFTLLKMVTPLTYAVANVTKRIAVISVSLLLLKNPVTVANLGGMMLAVLGQSQVSPDCLMFSTDCCSGVFCYNRAKHRENIDQRTLPVSRPPQPSPSLWDNHLTFDSKVTVRPPSNYFMEEMRRNQ